MTEADYDSRVAFLLQVRDKFNEVQGAIKHIRQLRTQINDFTGRVSDTVAAKNIKTAADTITRQLTGIEEALYQTKSKSGQDVLNFPIRLNDKLAGIFDVASSGENTPSKQAREAFADLSAQSDQQLKKLEHLMTTEIPALNKLILNSQVPAIGIPKE